MKMELFNLALGAKLTWKLFKFPNKSWCKVMRNKYIDSKDPEKILTTVNSSGGSTIWKSTWERGYYY